MTYAISSNNQKLVAQSEALKKIHEHNRDYLSLKITIPLGNTALKKVHTNQWLFTDLPKEFDLANWTVLADALNSNTNRYEGYVKNRWYIEAVDISVDAKGDSKMTLTLNAFASSYESFIEANKSMSKAYTDAVNNQNKNTNKNKTNAVSNSKTNTSLKGGEGKFIDNLVKKIVGKETDALKKAKLIHEHIRARQHYSYYECSRYKTPEQCYNNIKHLNCADMSRLTASMFRSAGISCYVVKSTCHFYTVINYKGKLYCSDNASSNSTGRPFNQYWKGNSCKSGSTVSFKGKSSYFHVCGKNPCC